MPNGASKGRVVVLGASGFVGRHLCPALVGAGLHVRATSRSPARETSAEPDVDWVSVDLDRPETLTPALEGCCAAYFLVHRIGTGRDYADREAATAEQFANAAAQAGLERIIYLGGVAPRGKSSRHLESRANTGRILRAGQVPTLELRAAMILGAGSTSWSIVRDLAVRLPAMVLPKWLDNGSWPVDIDDVVFALVGALDLPAEPATWELPGPERLSHRQCLARAARLLGRRTPMVRVPVVTPALSSYWIALVTRAGLETSRELVEGLRYDLEPTGDAIWTHLPEHELTRFDVAARRALEDEGSSALPSAPRRERLLKIGASLRRISAAG